MPRQRGAGWKPLPGTGPAEWSSRSIIAPAETSRRPETSRSLRKRRRSLLRRGQEPVEEQPVEGSDDDTDIQPSSSSTDHAYDDMFDDLSEEESPHHPEPQQDAEVLEHPHQEAEVEVAEVEVAEEPLVHEGAPIDPILIGQTYAGHRAYAVWRGMEIRIEDFFGLCCSDFAGILPQKVCVCYLFFDLSPVLLSQKASGFLSKVLFGFSRLHFFLEISSQCRRPSVGGACFSWCCCS